MDAERLTLRTAGEVDVGDRLVVVAPHPSHQGQEGQVVARDVGARGVRRFRLRFAGVPEAGFINRWWRWDELGRPKP